MAFKQHCEHFKQLQFHRGGFSLVELMIVIAIVGTLTSIAVPQFREYTNNARRSQAKTGLSSMHMALQSFHGEWLTYFGDWRNLGFRMEGDIYYRVGFQSNTGNLGPRAPRGYTGPGAPAGRVATELNSGFWCPGVNDCEETNTICFLQRPQGFGVDWFVAGACGLVTDATGTTSNEYWSINQNKKLRKSLVP